MFRIVHKDKLQSLLLKSEELQELKDKHQEVKELLVETQHKHFEV